MKIGYICSDVDVQLFGYEGCSVHIREFTNALVDAGHDVFIICAWAGDASNAKTNARVYHLEPSGNNGIAWQQLSTEPDIENNHLERDLGSMLWNTWLQIDGAEILEREQPDFIYERYALFGWGGVELSRRFNIPLIMELNAPLCDQQHGYHKFPFHRTARHMEPQIIRSADAVVALTQWLADWATDLGVDSSRIHILPDGVSNRLFAGAVSGRSVREQLHYADEQVVGFVGSFHGWHDVGGLIDAFSQLYARNRKLRLLLVGDGENRKLLEKKTSELGLSDAVTFTGKVPHEQVPHYIAAMDVAVVPYQPIKDFFFSPMKLFECMAVGRPTIAANMGQIAEVIEHGVTGWLYPPGDNEKLAEGVGTLLADRDLAFRIGTSAREQVLNRYTWNHVTGEVIKIAERLIDRNKRA